MEIIVLGMHRSGTSLVTRLINMMGVHVADTEDETIGYNEENPKGFWERRDVVECNDRLLAAQQSSWFSFANWQADPALHTEKEAIEQIVEQLGHAPHWVVKDPRLCLTLPYWRPYCKQPIHIISYRNPIEVAKSLEIRNQLPLYYGIALWEYYMVNALNHTIGLSHVYVQYHDFIRTPMVALRKLYDQLQGYGMQDISFPKEKEILSFVSPELYRSKEEEIILEEVLNEKQLALIEYCQGKKVVEAPLQCSASTQSILPHFFKMHEIEKDHHLICEIVSQIRHILNIDISNHQDNYRDIIDYTEDRERFLRVLLSFRHDIGKAMVQLEELLHLLEGSGRWRLGCRIIGIMQSLRRKPFVVGFEDVQKILDMIQERLEASAP